MNQPIKNMLNSKVIRNNLKFLQIVKNYARVSKRDSKILEKEERIGFQHMNIDKLLVELFPNGKPTKEEAEVNEIFKTYTEEELYTKLFPETEFTTFGDEFESIELEKPISKSKEEIMEMFKKLLQ
jgi:hypothetical protein